MKLRPPIISSPNSPTTGSRLVRKPVTTQAIAITEPATPSAQPCRSTDTASE